MKNLKKVFYSAKAAPYFFVCPFVLLFLIFFMFPVISTVKMSFQNIVPGSEAFVGLNNYKVIFSSDIYYTVLKNSFVYTVFALILVIPIPMILAVILNNKKVLFNNFIRSALFVPTLTSVVVAGIIFRLIFGESPTALMNSILSILGIGPLKWLQQYVPAYICLEALTLWRWCGLNIVYFLSGLQSIPEELYESASLDGANSVQKFLYITFPMLKNITIYVLTISVYGGLAMFTESYIVFNGNSSPMNMGLTIVGYLYKEGLQQGRMGIGSAIGVSLLIITLAVNLIQLCFTGFFKKEGR